ncbi:MAG: Crp/Fnr family transcriptional regulator [Cyanophyceae cyanobacterium]
MSQPKFDNPVNQLLAALPQADYQRLCPHFQAVQLSQNKILYSAGEDYNFAYFPSHSVISSIAILENGATTEIGVVGNEGMVGLPIILDSSFTQTTAIVQVGNSAWKIPAAALKAEFDRDGALQKLLLRYIQARLVQLGQTAACNRHHSIEQRFARWLLTVRDSTQRHEFRLTQEFISQMLGVRRAGVSEVASEFQKAEIIRYHRGWIKIVDQMRLELASCECYPLIAQEFSRLVGSRSKVLSSNKLSN